MGTEFTPIFLFILVAIVMAIATIAIAHLVGPTKSTSVKLMPYESGMDPIGDARQRFDVRYYLVAIVFLLFDVELLYLYPWAVGQWSVTATAPETDTIVLGAVTVQMKPAPGLPTSSTEVGIPPVFRNLVFAEVLIFIGVLAAGYAYVWKKGVFEWR